MFNVHIRSLATLCLALLTVFGTLVDQTTGQPLTGVRVHAVGPASARATTDSRGRFNLTALDPGEYTVTVQSNDVPPQSFHVRLGRTSITRRFKACSTTLDYHCAAPGGGGGGA